MSETDYTKVYEGSFILSERINTELKSQGINTLLRDHGESQRLSGYPISLNDFREIFVNNEDATKALEIVNRVRAEMEA
ncbi:DUF2007 domain-containing protein [Winogradskyella maritima]|uniref:Signal transducing protein n=1 Tax=Winogradskyella maritima TaxID=1517766 RepID=A0ABV8AHB8_9FLAO|nr:DUF2007 domain-containing protein [Winogradskyella maritima]